MSGSLMEEVSTYLQNSGYSIEEQQGYCTFEHPEKMWFAVQETEKGLVFSTVVTGDTELDPQVSENLSLVNLINRNSANFIVQYLRRKMGCRLNILSWALR